MIGDYTIGIVDILDPWRVQGPVFVNPLRAQTVVRRRPTTDDFLAYTGSTPDQMADLERRNAESARFMLDNRRRGLMALREKLAVGSPFPSVQSQIDRDLANIDEELATGKPPTHPFGPRMDRIELAPAAPLRAFDLK